MLRVHHIGVVIGALALFGGGVSTAGWSAGAAGAGRARSVQAAPLIVEMIAGPADLYPGSNAGALHFRLTNENPYLVSVTDVVFGAITSSDPQGCPPSFISVPSSSAVALLAPAGSSGVIDLQDVVSMSSDAPDACQGSSFDVAVTLSGTQV